MSTLVSKKLISIFAVLEVSDSTDRGLTDHVDSLFQDYTTHNINFCYHNEHIYVYMLVCFVFVIYYDLQVHSHIMG